MNRTEKADLIDELRSDLAQAKSIVLASHVGMNANTVGELRTQLRAANITYRVVKNTLAKLALQGTEMESISDMFRGPIAIAYSFEDALAPARIIRTFAKKNDKYVIHGGYFDGARLNEDDVKQLADMPSKEVLQAKLLGLFKAVPTKFLLVLKAKEEHDAAAEAA